MPMTPRPWIYDPDTRTIWDSNDDMICEVTDTKEGLEGDDPAAEANAHAIAACPDLIAALKSCILWCQILESEHHHAEPSYRDLRADIDKAEAALAEALGEEPAK